jgi:parallel beta-helix repeat protein
MVLAIAPPMWARPVYSLTPQTWKISQQDTSPLPQTAALIYVSPQVNPNLGANGSGANGSPNNPYASITAALATKPVAGTVIQLMQGTYSAETGEIFPIKLPSGVILRGEPTVRGVNTLILGSGKFISPTFASQNITILANDDVRIEGLTLTNPNTRGTAIWVESSKRVDIANNTFTNNDREGVFLTGSADAIIRENLFKKNGANGLSAVGSSTGEIRNNIFESTGFGLAIGQKSRVNVSNNNILNNTDGIIISNLSAPILRNNLIADNKRNGIVILKDRKGYPTPDLGTSISLGKNIFRNNLEKDLNNNSGITQVAVGNELDLKKISGEIAFIGESPTMAAPQVASIPLVPVVTSTNNATTINTIEITRSPQPTPQPSFNLPTTPPNALPPSSRSIFIAPLIESLPDVPPISLSSNLTQKPNDQYTNDILIDRSPIPVMPPRSPFIPSTQPQQSPSPTPAPTAPVPVPYNSRIAALVPRPAIDKFPYLVVIPSSDSAVLNRVQSVVPNAKIIPSRFGNIIMVQGYSDRDRAEVLKSIMRSEIGLDARVVHQNSL